MIMTSSRETMRHKIKVTEASNPNLIGSGEVVLTPKNDTLGVQVTINGTQLDLTETTKFDQVSLKSDYKSWIVPMGLATAGFVLPPIAIGALVKDATQLTGLAAFFVYTSFVVPPYAAGSYATYYLMKKKSRWLIEMKTGYLKIEGPEGVLSFLAGIHAAPTVSVEAPPAAAEPAPAPA